MDEAVLIVYDLTSYWNYDLLLHLFVNNEVKEWQCLNFYIVECFLQFCYSQLAFQKAAMNYGHISVPNRAGNCLFWASILYPLEPLIIRSI